MVSDGDVDSLMRDRTNKLSLDKRTVYSLKSLYGSLKTET